MDQILSDPKKLRKFDLYSEIYESVLRYICIVIFTLGAVAMVALALCQG